MSLLTDCYWVQITIKLGSGLTIVGGVINYCLCCDWSLRIWAFLLHHSKIKQVRWGTHSWGRAVNMYYLACTSTFVNGSKVLILSWQNCDGSPYHQLAMGRGLRILRAKAQAQQILPPKAATAFINRQVCFLFFYQCNIMYMLPGILFGLFSRPPYSPFILNQNPFFGSSLFIWGFSRNLSSWPDIFIFFSISPNSYSVMSLYAIVCSVD